MGGFSLLFDHQFIPPWRNRDRGHISDKTSSSFRSKSVPVAGKPESSFNSRDIFQPMSSSHSPIQRVSITTLLPLLDHPAQLHVSHLFFSSPHCPIDREPTKHPLMHPSNFNPPPKNNQPLFQIDDRWRITNCRKEKIGKEKKRKPTRTKGPTYHNMFLHQFL